MRTKIIIWIIVCIIFFLFGILWGIQEYEYDKATCTSESLGTDCQSYMRGEMGPVSTPLFFGILLFILPFVGGGFYIIIESEGGKKR